MRIKEVLKKGCDLNDTSIQQKLTYISDDDNNFRDNYVIEWEIKKQKSEMGEDLI